MESWEEREKKKRGGGGGGGGGKGCRQRAVTKIKLSDIKLDLFYFFFLGPTIN